MYTIRLALKAKKQLSKIDSQNKERIIRGLEKLRFRPFSHIKKLVSDPRYSLRVGDYRVILRVENNELLILVIEIGHRKNIYKKQS